LAHVHAVNASVRLFLARTGFTDTVTDNTILTTVH